MLKAHLPSLFDNDPDLRARADRLAARTYELVGFLSDVRHFSPPAGLRRQGSYTYHDSCSGLRELGLKSQPRRLLEDVGVKVVEMAEPETCCGFGGTFCVKYPEISGRMVADKARDIASTQADTVLAGDLGCLLNMAGALRRGGFPTHARHVAEVLVEGSGDNPAIGQEFVPRR
jgi:L-lactate dehydrogenase complex protein LldE